MENAAASYNEYIEQQRSHMHKLLRSWVQSCNLPPAQVEKWQTLTEGIANVAFDRGISAQLNSEIHLFNNRNNKKKQ